MLCNLDSLGNRLRYPFQVNLLNWAQMVTILNLLRTCNVSHEHSLFVLQVTSVSTSNQPRLRPPWRDHSVWLDAHVGGAGLPRGGPSRLARPGPTVCQLAGLSLVYLPKLQCPHLCSEAIPGVSSSQGCPGNSVNSPRDLLAQMISI